MNHWDLYLRVRMACIQDALAEGKSVAEIAILFGLETVQARTLCALATETPAATKLKREVIVRSVTGTPIMSFDNHGQYQDWYDRQTKSDKPPLECWKHPYVTYTFTSRT